MLEWFAYVTEETVYRWEVEKSSHVNFDQLTGIRSEGDLLGSFTVIFATSHKGY